MPHLKKSCRSSRGSTKSSGPNIGLELTAYSVRCAPAFSRSSGLALGVDKQQIMLSRKVVQHYHTQTPGEKAVWERKPASRPFHLTL
jgi:hypothetical protein